MGVLEGRRKNKASNPFRSISKGLIALETSWKPENKGKKTQQVDCDKCSHAFPKGVGYWQQRECLRS